MGRLRRPLFGLLMSDRIFISVASYCDPLLLPTLRTALQQARHPERLVFGVVEQQLPELRIAPDPAWAHQLRRIQLHPLEARGPCWARSLAMSLWQGESWFLQIDSHTWFEPGWDEHLLDWSARCALSNPRHIITCYPNPFDWVDGEAHPRTVSDKVLAHVVKQDQSFSTDHPVLYFESVPVNTDHAVLGMHLGAGCLFAPGEIIQALPYDPYLYFHGEEQAYALRAWTRGWDIFHVPGVRMYHLYTDPQAAPRPLHWSDELDQQRVTRSAALDLAAQQRLRSLLWEGNDLGVYGLGTVRSLENYAEFSGIDYARRQIEDRARKQLFGY